MSSTRELLAELAANLRWTWNGEFDFLFREIDDPLWTEVNHNPTAFLLEADAAKVEARANDSHYRVRLERACASLRGYVASQRHWAARLAPSLTARPIAYFCAEFGLHESIPIYSGGLGILSGDHLKSSSDLGIPIWGVSLLYREGYFLQHLDADGTQQEVYQDLDLRRVAIERVNGPDGKPLTVEFPVNSGKISVDVWWTNVGRANLLLLEGYQGSDASGKHPLAKRLYGGDQKSRLLQELILGVGGYYALKALGIRPGVIHLNEGHCAFATIAAVTDAMEEEGLSFNAAADKVRRQTIFTTHTPVAAGHDRFPPNLVDEHLAPLYHRLGLNREGFLGLGRIRPGDPNETFCMTVLALKLAHRSNAVSTLHGQVSRTMWRDLWSGRSDTEVPIGHITNGVHVPSWIHPRMAQFFDRHLGQGWLTRLCRSSTWDGIYSADPFEVWDAKCAIKRSFVGFAGKRLSARAERVGFTKAVTELNPEALTIGFGRRFVEYKRPALIFRDPDRLARILSDPMRPVQLVFAGKAHPNDEVGKILLRQICQFARDPKFKGRVFLLENYDMNMGRRMVQGCDLWLNNPRRPLEACGTSGQKAIFNGTLNLSTLDGWWAEAFDGKNGYAFGNGLTHTDPTVQDQ
ncbi:MAG: alpha-glucan family phosphorylase [Pseudomonadota bacterium]